MPGTGGTASSFNKELGLLGQLRAGGSEKLVACPWARTLMPSTFPWEISVLVSATGRGRALSPSSVNWCHPHVAVVRDQGQWGFVPGLWDTGSEAGRETRKVFKGSDGKAEHLWGSSPEMLRAVTGKSPGSVSNHVLFLLIDPPHSTPKCWAESSSSGLMLQLFCSWPGGYPHPTLHWREEGRDLENSSWVISSTSSSDTHVETLNSSQLSHRQVFKCVGSHVVRQEEPACTVEISESICLPPSLLPSTDTRLVLCPPENKPPCRGGCARRGSPAAEMHPGTRLVQGSGALARLRAPTDLPAANFPLRELSSLGEGKRWFQGLAQLRVMFCKAGFTAGGSCVSPGPLQASEGSD